MTEEENKDVVIYGIGGGYCGYCDQAKNLLDRKNIDYTYIEATESEQFATEFVAKGFRTVPQITINGEHIGGYNDLVSYFAQSEESVNEATN